MNVEYGTIARDEEGKKIGFMLPQSANTKEFLELIKSYPDIPSDVVESLLGTIKFNEKTEKKEVKKNDKGLVQRDC